jgi:hypothetical protein
MKTDAEIKDLIDTIHSAAEFSYSTSAPQVMRRIVEELRVEALREVVGIVYYWLKERAEALPPDDPKVYEQTVLEDLSSEVEDAISERFKP